MKHRMIYRSPLPTEIDGNQRMRLQPLKPLDFAGKSWHPVSVVGESHPFDHVAILHTRTNRYTSSYLTKGTRL